MFKRWVMTLAQKVSSGESPQGGVSYVCWSGASLVQLSSTQDSSLTDQTSLKSKEQQVLPEQLNILKQHNSFTYFNYVCLYCYAIWIFDLKASEQKLNSSCCIQAAVPQFATWLQKGILFQHKTPFGLFQYAASVQWVFMTEIGPGINELNYSYQPDGLFYMIQFIQCHHLTELYAIHISQLFAHEVASKCQFLWTNFSSKHLKLCE